MQVSFSLSESAVIHPMLQRCAPMKPNPSAPYTLTDKALHYGQAWVAMRVYSWFIAFTATFDTLAHALALSYKTCSYLVGKIGFINSSYSFKELSLHFYQAIRFFITTFIGPILGNIYPPLFAYLLSYRLSNTSLPDISAYPQSLEKLLQDVRRDGADAHTAALKRYWRRSSLNERTQFVYAFSYDPFLLDDRLAAIFARVRTIMQDIVYEPIGNAATARWLSNEEISTNLVGHNISQDIALDSFYYIAVPTFEKLIEILNSKNIPIRHEREFRGVFASTKPVEYGCDCILVLKRNIERVCKPRHVFTRNTTDHSGNAISMKWVSFSENIPITPQTLSCVAFTNADSRLIDTYSSHIVARTATSWNVKTVTMAQINQFTMVTHNLGMGVPKEWKDTVPNRQDQDRMLKLLRDRNKEIKDTARAMLQNPWYSRRGAWVRLCHYLA